MSLEAMQTNVLNQSADIAKYDFETEGGARICAAVLGMAKTKFLRAWVDSLSEASSNSAECQECVSWRM